MSEQRHIIKRQVIELTVRDAAHANRLHDEVSRIYRQRIVPLIDQYCTELSAPDRLHRIERLELDVGVIDAEHFEADLVAKVSAQLRQALAAQIGEPARAAGRPNHSPEALPQLELFALFARSGSLPWWADATAPQLLEDTLQQLIQHAPAPLRRLMRDLAHEPGPLQRIVDHIPDALLAELAGILAPAVLLARTQALLALIELLQTTHAAGRTPSQLRRIVWSTLLYVAGLAGRQYSGIGAFYQAALRRIATALGTSYGELLADLRRSARAGPGPRRAALASILDALEPERPGTAISAEAALDQYLAQLQSAGGSLAGVWALLRTLAARLAAPIRGELLAMLSELEDHQVPPALAQRILHLLQSAPAQLDLSPAELSNLTHMLRAAASAEAVPSAAVETTIDLRFSDADELYIGNAGLVILWPFLSSFFARVGMLEGRRFKDIAAQQRAAGLLQHIATGELAFPEYLLPLNKVLCGIGPTEVFDFGPPLLDFEAQACADLLRAVIVQAPILRDMSPDGFRGTFLLRPAVLSARDGAWLLRVERQTYDLVLDRFPWGWEWVRLPWMAAPLRVEW